jgi:hypothetical protein
MRNPEILLCLGLLGCSLPAHAEVDCKAQAAGDMELNLSAGVYTERAQVRMPLKIRIPTGTNPTAFGNCLEVEGRDPSKRMVETVNTMQDCRRSTSAPRLVAVAGGGTRITGGVDEAAYAECVRYDIDVEVLLPTAAVD